MKEKDVDIQAIYRENKNVLWCLSSKDAYLYRIDLQRGMMEEVMPLAADADMPNMFLDILGYGECLVFVPACSDFLVLWDRKKRICQRVPLPKAKYEIGNTGIKFFSGMVYGDSLYLFGHSYPGIVKMDLLSHEFEVMDGWVENGELALTAKTEGCFWRKYCFVDGKLYLPFMNANAVLKLDLESGGTEVCRVGNADQHYISMEWDGKNFWLVPRDARTGNIIKWNPVNGAVEYYGQFPEGFNYAQYAFGRTVKIGEKVLLFANDANMNICMDTGTGRMEMFPDPYAIPEVTKSRYRFAELTKEKIFFHCRNQCVYWDFRTGETECLPYSVDERIFVRYEMQREKRRLRYHFACTRKGVVVPEQKEFGIGSLIKYLQFASEEREKDGYGRKMDGYVQGNDENPHIGKSD